ncbi:hypothetical protein ElyMa_002914700 [Elysia marginata]|uniref:Secreted protein n=1 Tax=Elysia marginata TaxID=1093978 RepID=A0AAV4I7D1_9GAST|nr:hypothetical protein ElyMa_002914700 [Elysia marginata]
MKLGILLAIMYGVLVTANAGRGNNKGRDVTYTGSTKNKKACQKLKKCTSFKHVDAWLTTYPNRNNLDLRCT